MRKWRPNKITITVLEGLIVESKPFQPQHSHITHGISKKVKIQEAEIVSIYFVEADTFRHKDTTPTSQLSEKFRSFSLCSFPNLCSLKFLCPSPVGKNFGPLGSLCPGGKFQLVPSPETVVSKCAILLLLQPPPLLSRVSFLMPRASQAPGHLIWERKFKILKP